MARAETLKERVTSAFEADNHASVYLQVKSALHQDPTALKTDGEHPL